MVSINYATREVSCKIVYYGPGLSGKTTNLQYVHQKVPSDTKGKLISLATDADRTLYFDFLPINIGTINGFAAKFQLYTVPGQVYYNATRKLVLRGTDGVVFVADSQPDKMDENIESLNNLKENLAEYGYSFDELPFVIQYNKQDLPGVLSMEDMRSALNGGNWPEFGASATEGFGVFDTLKCILKMVLDKAKSSSDAPRPQQVRAQGSGPIPTTQVQPQPAPQQQQMPPAHNVPPPQPAQQPAAQPVQQPAYAPAAQQQVQTAPPPQQQQPYSPPTQPEQQQPQYEREAVPQPPPQQQAPDPNGYRPFPGNTVEDEHRMTVRSTVQTGQIQTQPDQQPNIEQSQQQSATAPQMAPSLKAAEKAEKPKKRSFFKRLFGLK